MSKAVRKWVGMIMRGVCGVCGVFRVMSRQAVIGRLSAAWAFSARLRSHE